MAELAYCNPDILKWARERLGYSLEEAARKINISNPEKLRKAENKEANITVNQLHNASKKYGIPISYFYLNTQPDIKRLQTQSFRLNADADHAYTPEINKTLFWAQDVREDLIGLSEQGHFPINHFSWSIEGKSPKKLAGEIRDYFKIEETGYSNPNQAYKWWKDKVESTGVLILETDRYQNFNISGAAIFFEYVPIIVLNGTEPYKRKKLFTLLHEFSHLIYEDSSLDEFQTTINQRDGIEKHCNELARMFLLPNSDLLHTYSQLDGDELEKVTKIANQFSVSRFVVTIALKDTGIFTRDLASKVYNFLEEEFKNHRAELAQQRSKRASSGGPPPHILKSNKLGKPYSQAVISALWAGDLKQNQAVSMLDNMNIKHFEKFSERIFSR